MLEFERPIIITGNIDAAHHVNISILLTKITTAQNLVAFSYYIVRGLYFLAVVFVANIYIDLLLGWLSLRLFTLTHIVFFW